MLPAVNEPFLLCDHHFVRGRRQSEKRNVHSGEREGQKEVIAAVKMSLKRWKNAGNNNVRLHVAESQRWKQGGPPSALPHTNESSRHG